MFSSLVNTILGVFSQIGYGGVVALMAIESSILPLPSEIVIPPAAYLAADGHFNIILIILAGAIGSVIGALINYALAYYLGRPVVYRLASTKWARFILVTPEKIKKAEDLFLTKGRSATFIGRLFPVVRHLISIPAGFSKMPLRPFVTYTFLGSFLWVSILAALGYFLGANKELLEEYYTAIFWTLVIVCSLSLAYVYYHRRRKKNN